MPADIEQLTIEILTLSDTLERDRAESVVEIGERMLTVRESLAHGEWRTWLETVPYTRQSAHNYMGLARWAAADPRAFGRMKGLGPTKLYALKRLPADVLAGLPDPGSEEDPQLERMSVAQVHALVKELVGSAPKRVAISRVVASSRRRVRGLAKAVQTLADRREELEPGTIAELLDELRGLVDSLEAAR